MSELRKIHFDKLYNFDRKGEIIGISLPFSKGELKSPSDIVIYDGDKKPVLSQSHLLSSYNDSSIKYAYVYFEADLPANKAMDYYYGIGSNEPHNEPDIIEEKNGEFFINTGCIHVQANKTYKKGIGLISFNKRYYGEKDFEGPILTDKYGKIYSNRTDNIQIVYNGPVCAVIRFDGTHIYNEDAYYTYSLYLTFFRNKSYFDIRYRINNNLDSLLQIQSLYFKYTPNEEFDNARILSGVSDYDTKLTQSTIKEKIEAEVTQESLLYESFEHYPEVFLGTFYGDYTDDNVGVCATLYQAKQNFPKSFSISKDGLTINIVPKGYNKIILQPGMSKSQNVLIHFHDKDLSLKELDDISTLYQMPDYGIISKEEYKKTGLFEDFLTDRTYDFIDTALIDLADSHGRALGIVNYGDYPDMGYTNQGRGKDSYVWANNEYDFPHACALLFLKTGYRRFFDYMKVSALHQMEIDICHSSNDPLLLGGQWMHCSDHALTGQIVCSHQWVEGLIDYYHMTGDIYALENAIGIGNNLKRLLETDKYTTPGKANARETGWALRSFVALYNETGNKAWLEKCDMIVSHFTEWKEMYGEWLAPYTNNTSIRVPFMISIAIGSLYRYYEIVPKEDIKKLIIDATDDLIANAMLPNGMFYYKELPSLSRSGTNPLILEALAIAYKLTGNKEYLKYGLKTLKTILAKTEFAYMGKKTPIEDSILVAGHSPKKFAQAMVPLTRFAQYCENEGLISNE